MCELSGLGNTPRKNVQGEMLGSHAGLGLQVCTYSGYDLCHPGYIAYRQTHSLTHSQRDRQTAFDRLYY